jgi:alpha-glucosidase
MDRRSGRAGYKFPRLERHFTNGGFEFEPAVPDLSALFRIPLKFSNPSFLLNIMSTSAQADSAEIPAIEKPFSKSAREGRNPKRVVSILRIALGVELNLEEGGGERVRIEFLGRDIGRISFSSNGVFDATCSHAIHPDFNPAPIPFEISEDAHLIAVTSESLHFVIGKNPFSIDAFRPDGTPVVRGLRSTADPEGGFLTLRSRGPEDHFFGLGEKTGRFNRDGRNLTLWNSDVLAPAVSGGYSEVPNENPMRDPTSLAFDPYYISIPFFYHMPERGDAMSGFFFDNAHRAEFDFSQPDELAIRFRDGFHTEYVFAGPRMEGILASYTSITGRISAPPIWALGHHQCRWHDYTQSDIEALSEKIRAHKVPCDVVWLDIDYMRGYRVFTWDPETYPDPAALLLALQKKNLRAITIIDPGVKHEPGYEIYDDALAGNLLCRSEDGGVYIGQVWPGDTAFPDFSKPETREWWGRLNAAHVRSGIAGIWNDMNEPATGDVPEDGMLFNDGTEPHGRRHNEYAILMAMGTVAGLLEAMPDRRTFVLSRAGSAGIQRYAANWLGDNCSRWDHLWLSIPMAMGLGVSGQPFVGADIGGFMGNSSAELLVRWYQYGALTPFCRNHNTKGSPDQYPWTFGEENLELCRAALRLRYRLLPEIYSAFLRAMETGEPIQRPLVFDFQNDPAVWGIDDQYLFGPHLLVAPVYSEGCTSREVYLPTGTWHCWHTGRVFNGRSRILAQTPIDRIPVYAKGGSVVSCWVNPPDSTMGFHPEQIELNIFAPGEDGETISFLQEDDGTTFAFREGAFVRTTFTALRRGDDFQLTAKVSGEGFPEFSRKQFLLKFHGFVESEIFVNGKEIDGESFQLPNAGMDFEIAAKFSKACAG